MDIGDRILSIQTDGIFEKLQQNEEEFKTQEPEMWEKIKQSLGSIEDVGGETIGNEDFDGETIGSKDFGGVTIGNEDFDGVTIGNEDFDEKQF